MGISSVDQATVVHVDDEPRFAEMVSTFLEREDSAFTVHTSGNVEDALQYLHELDVDAVVSDYEMPGRNGLDFLQVVRDRFPKLPFILFTGKGSEEIASRAISAGVTDYLQKEGSTDQYTILANRLLNTIRAHHAEEAVQRTEERYHNLVDTAPIPIVLFDPAGELVYANDAAVEFLHADSQAQLQGERFTAFLHPNDQGVSKDRFERLMTDEVSVPGREFRIRTVDGTVKTAIISTAYGYYQDEKVAQAIVQP